MQQSAVVVGHSYIRRLGQFMSQVQYTNLGLREEAVECIGVGGARISRYILHTYTVNNYLSI